MNPNQKGEKVIVKARHFDNSSTGGSGVEKQGFRNYNWNIFCIRWKVK